jgi:hypothetical protein
MNSQKSPHSNSNPGVAPACDVDATLRLVANLPAPDGLEDRMLAGLRSAPPSGRVLKWPGENWLRTAAAAAIVFVIVGGGWEISSHFRSGNVVVTPSNTGTAGGFSNAGAVRVPQTLPSPIAAPVPVQSPELKSLKNVRNKVDSGSKRVAKSAAVGKVPSDSVDRDNPAVAGH